ncbi:hypothetical protein IJI94_03565 [Candidatus Saccharibacteria bacterium]|nr:hypothetical protein [Candidatus Saccharibacteria bacterium]
MDNQFNDDELQKAIDDITKDAASGGSSSVVDDLVKKNEENAPAGKVVSASTDMDDGQPAFAPAPEVPVPPVTDMSAPTEEKPVENKPEEVIPGPEAASEEAPKAEDAPVAGPEAAPATPEIIKNDTPAAGEPAPTEPSGDFEKTREEALKALYPLMDKVKIDDPVQKFDMYKEMFGLMKNAEVAGSVLKAAEELPDEQTKADALMGLIKTIDELK